MIIMPPRELMKYIALNEDGEWIHADEMPAELQEVFDKFVENYRKAELYKSNFAED